MTVFAPVVEDGTVNVQLNEPELLVCTDEGDVVTPTPAKVMATFADAAKPWPVIVT